MKVNQLIDRFTHNWPQKLVCFVFALFLYLFYHMSQVDRKTIVIPLKVYDQGEVMLVSNIPSSVKLTVRADKNNISSIKNSDFTASINLNYLTESGNFRVPVVLVVSDSISALDPLEVKMSPEVIDVTVDKRITKPVSVEVQSFGETAHGYMLSNISVNPPFVNVTGPASIVNTLDSFKTSTVDLSDATKTFSKRVSIQNTNKVISLENVSDYSVTAEFEPVISEKNIEAVKLIPMYLNDRFEIVSEIPLFFARISGPLLTLESFKPEYINLNLSFITEAGDIEVPVNFNVPRGIEVVEKSADIIIISVVERPEAVEIEDRSEQSSSMLPMDFSFS
ncbi:MAG: CdaR family protein [Treponema sp.]|nr:CdaR family protein [Treponema sp.]